MNTLLKRLLAAASFVAALSCGTAGAQNASVEAVQAPAWVERGGSRVPASPGMQLQPADRVHTGAGSRILLRMPEGSTVKLGENARFTLASARVSRAGGASLFASAMTVAEGAFRFTTDALAKYRGKRDVNITFATVTAGIRGTDLWGKQGGDREIVCLIEGAIEVRRGQEAPVRMDQPLSFYIAPAGQMALPVAPVPPAQLAEWSAETEIAPGRGALRRGGRWGVTLAAAETQEDALKLYDEVRTAGYAAQIRTRHEGEKRTYEIRIAQLPSQAEARALAASLKGRFGQAEPKVGQ